MGKTIGAVILGYAVIVAVVFVTFGIAYALLGPDRSFQASTYDVSAIWIALAIALGLLAAVIGGRVTRAVAGNYRAVKILAVVVLVIGLVLAVAERDRVAAPAVRPPDAPMMEAMQSARQPAWLLFLNPVIGVVGVLCGGGSLRRRSETPV
ncbi:MAG: hypothetical protein ACRELC_06695 [Gemmatimonadota bacterium]